MRSIAVVALIAMFSVAVAPKASSADQALSYQLAEELLNLVDIQKNIEESFKNLDDRWLSEGDEYFPPRDHTKGYLSTLDFVEDDRIDFLNDDDYKDVENILLHPYIRIIGKKFVYEFINDLKNFVDIRPIRHWLEVRVRAHVFICVLALLLKRIFEINYMGGKCVMEPLEEISKSKLVKYKVKFSKKESRTQTFPKVTNTTPTQKKYFKMVGIRNPMSLEKFVW